MPAIDYSSVEDALKSLFDADSAINTLAVTEVEKRGDNTKNNLKGHIGIFIDRVDPLPGQPFAAGKTTNVDMVFKLVIKSTRMGSMDKTVRQRNAILQAVMSNLMTNRTISNNAFVGYLGPCEMGLEESEGFTAIAVQDFTAQAKITI